MWEGHIGSKAHRVAVSKLREREQLEEEEKRAAEKRKMEEEEEESKASRNKKRRVSEEVEEESYPAKSKSAKGGFPADFFSDSSREIPLSVEDEEEVEEATAPLPSDSELKSKTQLDLEWEAFQAALQQTPAEEDKEEEQRDTYHRATVMAEPELVSTANEGLPQASRDGEDPEAVEIEQKEETEAEKRKRKEQEDRELIMDRLIEEERAQEEADLRVNILKAKLEAAKKARSNRKKKS